MCTWVTGDRKVLTEPQSYYQEKSSLQEEQLERLQGQWKVPDDFSLLQCGPAMVANY